MTENYYCAACKDSDPSGCSECKEMRLDDLCSAGGPGLTEEEAWQLYGKTMSWVQFREMVQGLLAAEREECAKHIENHSCVATCCDAQPGSSEAKALADCLRRRNA